MSFVNSADTNYGLNPKENFKPEDRTIKIDVFFAEITSVISEYSCLLNFVDYKERETASRFQTCKDRDTYLLSHAILRLILSNKLDTDPAEICIVHNENNKPGLKDDLLFFNLSHTRKAFAFAISEHYPVGVDLEEVRNINFKSIINKFFSQEEQKYISESPDKSLERFFFIWTRKEAVLKAAGTGLIENLMYIDVSGSRSLINNQFLIKGPENPAPFGYFIHSEKIMDYYLSVASTERLRIRTLFVNKDFISSLII